MKRDDLRLADYLGHILVWKTIHGDLPVMKHLVELVLEDARSLRHESGMRP